MILTGCREVRDTGVCGVDTVVSAAVSGCLCDPGRVPRGVTVVGVGDVSVFGGGELDVGVALSGVDESVCCVDSVMTAGELDVCGYDSVVSDEAGESNGVEVVVSVDDVVACGDDPLVPDVVRVGDWLSVVSDALVFGAGVARRGRGGAESSVVWARGGPTWWGGRARLCRRFLAARATADSRNVFALLRFIGSCLLNRTWRWPLPLFTRLCDFYLRCIVHIVFSLCILSPTFL